MTGAAAGLETIGIGKHFGRFTALDGVDLAVGGGEFLTLLGPSGSGKTTFLMILAGFEPPSAGRLLLDGRDVTGTPAEDRAFGMVFQGYALFPHLSVEGNIGFPLAVRGLAGAELRRRVGAMIETIGLQGHGRKRPAALSGGQQQRVALARALVYEPSVLLLDEPFSALDRHLRGRMQEEVRRLHGESGTTFVFVTHDQSEALALSSRVAIFDHGRLQQIGAPREVYERPANRFVAEFLGDINVLPLAATASDGLARFEDVVLRTGDDAGVASDALAVRPEHMSAYLTKPPTGNAIAARVETLVYQGATTRLALRTAGNVPLSLSLPTERLLPGLAPGGQVWAGWPEEHGIFL